MESRTIACNKCEKSITPSPSQDMVSISLDFGYESRYDGQYWNFHLCDQCLEDVVKTFKIVPLGFLESSYLQLKDGKHQKVFDSWKENGEWEDLKYHTYEELLGLDGYIDFKYLNHNIQKYHQGKPLLEDYDSE